MYDIAHVFGQVIKVAQPRCGQLRRLVMSALTKKEGGRVILVAGGTGRLGRILTPMLTARGSRVRILTRDRARAQHLAGDRVEIVVGDLRDPAAVDRAMDGVGTAVSAVQAGFGATAGSDPHNVDLLGNRSLIRAAKAHGVQHLILLSIIDARPDHPLELWRTKFAVEQLVQASGLAWTVIRSAAFMEWCLDFVAVPLWTSGHTRVYGRGDNPINFVSAHDVARVVELAVIDPALRNTLLSVAGPENLSFNEVVRRIRTETGAAGRAGHVPLPMLWAMWTVMSAVRPAVAREIRAGIFLDIADRTADTSSLRAEYPSVPTTSMSEAIQHHYQGYRG